MSKVQRPTSKVQGPKSKIESPESGCEQPGSWMPASQFTEVAEVYDNLMSVVPYAWWVAYVRRLWWGFALEPRRVLELACGTGSVLEELLKLGYEVEGVDYSEPMLRVAARKLPEGTPLWCQDARALSLQSAPFDACLCLFDSLNYILDAADLRRAFESVLRHLVPGGSFIFDMNAIRALEKGMFDQSGTGKDSSLEYDWHSAWEPATRICTIQMEFRAHHCDGTRIFHETHVQRGYTLAEITGTLEAAGFEIQGAYDAFTTRPPTPKSDRYHFVARKPGGEPRASGPA
jgi:SAM-dependent methyltransferase